MKELKILDVKVNMGLSLGDVLAYVEHLMHTKVQQGIICTTNPEFIIDAQEDVEFKNIINESLLSIPDGFGTVLASDFLNIAQKVKSKGFIRAVELVLAGLRVGVVSSLSSNHSSISGVDLTYALCKLASEKKYNIVLLGGKKKSIFGKSIDNFDVATLAAIKLKDLYPNINIVAASSAFSYRESDDARTLSFIHESMSKHGVSNIDIIFVAYNHRNQEKWLKRNMNNVPCTIGVGVGGTIDYISGITPRAPYMIRTMHLEWLYRLVMQPWRYKRIFKAFPLFPIKVLLSTLKS